MVHSDGRPEPLMRRTLDAPHPFRMVDQLRKLYTHVHKYRLWQKNREKLLSEVFSKSFAHGGAPMHKNKKIGECEISLL